MAYFLFIDLMDEAINRNKNVWAHRRIRRWKNLEMDDNYPIGFDDEAPKEEPVATSHNFERRLIKMTKTTIKLEVRIDNARVV